MAVFARPAARRNSTADPANSRANTAFAACRAKRNAWGGPLGVDLVLQIEHLVNKIDGRWAFGKGGAARKLEATTAMPYNPVIRIEFDPAKDVESRQKHNVSLAFGAEVLSDRRRWDVLDARFDYAEDRYIAYGLAAGRIWICIFVRRGDVYRIISVRRANEREQRHYGNAPRAPEGF